VPRLRARSFKASSRSSGSLKDTMRIGVFMVLPSRQEGIIPAVDRAVNLRKPLIGRGKHHPPSQLQILARQRNSWVEALVEAWWIVESASLPRCVASLGIWQFLPFHAILCAVYRGFPYAEHEHFFA
jgi:hypothetical protein